MEQFISFLGYRNEPWRSHKNAANVARAIRYGRRPSLRIFELHDDGLGAEYTEVPREQWAERFGV